MAVVAYVLNQYPAPSHSFIRREIAALEELGHTVHRYVMRRPSVEVVDPDDRAEQERSHYVLDRSPLALATTGGRVLRRSAGRTSALRLAGALAARSGRWGHHLAYLAEAATVAEWADEVGAEHLHAHFGTNSAAVAALAGALSGRPYSFTVHGPEEFDDPVGLGLDLKAADAAFVATISDFGASQMMRWVGHDRWPVIRTVRCGLDQGWLGRPPTPAGDRPVLVNVGRLEEQKGQLLLVEAAARLVEKVPEAQLRIIGDGSLRPALTERITALGLTGNVHLLGWQDSEEVRAQLGAARALVLPSFAEGLPVSIMEAYAAGRPVVSTRIAGIPELVHDGHSGWLVPAGNPTALADAMLVALTTPSSDLDRMGRAGRELVSERHDAVVEASRLGDLIAGTTPPAPLAIPIGAQVDSLAE
ncbi:MAG: glycosyltransferase family 4 protein [Actinomycetota bacterium]